MFSWLKRKDEQPSSQRAATLYAAVREALGDDDDELIRITASVAALLLCVAYADLDYQAEEEDVLRATLGRIQGMDQRGVEAILQVLREQVVALAGAEASSYARELLGLTEEDFRLELLDVLVDVAAADDEITLQETNMLRSVAKALGLSQAQYNASQARHRDKLTVLKG